MSQSVFINFVFITLLQEQVLCSYAIILFVFRHQKDVEDVDGNMAEVIKNSDLNVNHEQK